MFLVAVCSDGSRWISDSVSKYLRLKALQRPEMRQLAIFSLIIHQKFIMKFNLQCAAVYQQLSLCG